MKTKLIVLLIIFLLVLDMVFIISLNKKEQTIIKDNPSIKTIQQQEQVKTNLTRYKDYDYDTMVVSVNLVGFSAEK